MIKLKEILMESTMTPRDAKFLNILVKNGIESDDVSGIYELLTKKFLINDNAWVGRLIIIYGKYRDELEEPIDFRQLKEYDIEYNPDEIEDEVLALSQHLDTHPLLINKGKYGDYHDPINDEEFAVYNEDDANDAFRQRAEEYVDEYIENGSVDWLESYIELDDYAVDQFANEDARSRIENYSAEEIINEYGAEDEWERRLTVVQDKLDVLENRWSEVDNEIVDVEYKIDELSFDIEAFDEELTDNMTQQSRVNDQSEVADLQNEYKGLLTSKNESKVKLEWWEEKLEELQYEFGDLEDKKDDTDELDSVTEDFGDELREDLEEKIAKDIIDDVEYEGLKYFTSNLGYEPKDAIEYFFRIDKESAIDDFESDRGNIMGSYDGNEHEEDVNGETYYIYRTN
tara:strand:- start:425 stop:1624 length:1200 start_codon:yes stop_codon:yes gene_type:complete